MTASLIEIIAGDRGRAAERMKCQLTEVDMEWFFGLIVAAIIGVLIGKDAEARGMSPLGWGLFSFLLCIVAVPLYLIVRKPRIGE